MRKNVVVAAVVCFALLIGGGGTVRTQGVNNTSRTGCRLLPSWNDLKAALSTATAQPNGFLQNQMWGTIVDRDGVVCAVAFTGPSRDNQ